MQTSSSVDSSYTLQGGPKDVAILFVDLVNSSVFASVMDLREYANYLASFHELCLRQCEYYFHSFREGVHRYGHDYSFQISGDELVVYMHTGRSINDVYQLACLAIILKTAWLAAPVNQERISRRAPVAEISAGIHHGPLWAVWKEDRLRLSGYGIHVAKRVEGISRQGQYYRIFLSDQAFKQIHHLLRHFLFTPRLRIEMKGIIGDAGVYEIAHSFLAPERRMEPTYAATVQNMIVDAITLATQDLWMHDLFQVWSEQKYKGVTDEAMELCRRVLHHSPLNPSALYHLAQAHRERSDFDMAEMLLLELTQNWPYFADGFLELGRLHLLTGKKEEAVSSLRRALHLGANEAKDELR